MIALARMTARYLRPAHPAGHASIFGACSQKTVRLEVRHCEVGKPGQTHSPARHSRTHEGTPMLLDRELRARTNQVAHQIGQRAAQEARQALTDRLETLRAGGADRADLVAFLAHCERVGQVPDTTETTETTL